MKKNETHLIGGANQFSLPFTMDLLEDLGIINEKGIYTKSVPKSQITNFRIEKEDLLHQ